MAMTLYVSSASPYSIKIWALMNYQGFTPKIVFQNVVNRFTTLKRLGGQTMVPMLHTLADGRSVAIQDSSRIAAYLSTQSSRPCVPNDPGLLALALLIEDYADEWVVRWFVSARWQGEDALDCSRRVGQEMLWNLPGAGALIGKVIGTQIKSTLERAGVISDSGALTHSRDRLLLILETLFEKTPFVFGFEPSIADFALYGMLWQFRSDLTGAKILKGYPNLNRYLDQIDAWRFGPVVPQSGPARPLEELKPLIDEIHGTYLGQLRENLVAKTASSRMATLVTPDGERLEFRTNRYLIDRLREILKNFSDVYHSRKNLLPLEGAIVEEGLMGFVESVRSSDAGRNLLKELHFPEGGSPSTLDG